MLVHGPECDQVSSAYNVLHDEFKPGHIRSHFFVSA